MPEHDARNIAETAAREAIVFFMPADVTHSVDSLKLWVE